MLSLWKPFTTNGFWSLDRALDAVARGPIVESAPPVEIVEDADAYTVMLDLPGHQAKDIQITLERDVVEIRSERRRGGEDKGRTYHRSEICYGAFVRSFQLPTAVDGDKTEARFEGGVLTLVLPKREEAKPRTVQIKVAGE